MRACIMFLANIAHDRSTPALKEDYRNGRANMNLNG